MCSLGVDTKGRGEALRHRTRGHTSTFTPSQCSWDSNLVWSPGDSDDLLNPGLRRVGHPRTRTRTIPSWFHLSIVRTDRDPKGYCSFQFRRWTRRRQRGNQKNGGSPRTGVGSGSTRLFQYHGSFLSQQNYSVHDEVVEVRDRISIYYGRFGQTPSIIRSPLTRGDTKLTFHNLIASPLDGRPESRYSLNVLESVR